MFENPEAKRSRRGAAFWATMVFSALSVLFVLNLIRVNIPERKAARATPFVPPHTEGKIAYEVARVDAASFLPYRANFNHRVTVKGQFSVDRGGPWITMLVLDEKNYRLWQSGDEFATLISTGKVPFGKISKVLEPGTYYFVLDNRGSDKDVFADIDLNAE
jgi:hypothetical protein